MSDKLLDIPTYFSKYVDKRINLRLTPNIPCPFHGEVHGKSFSYSETKGIWRCWGQCHSGGDVVALHRLNYKFPNYEAAKRDLYKREGLRIDTITFETPELKVDDNLVHSRTLYNRAVTLARESTNVDDWVDLDYIVSQVDFTDKDLEQYLLRSANNAGMEE